VSILYRNRFNTIPIGIIGVLLPAQTPPSHRAMRRKQHFGGRRRPPTTGLFPIFRRPLRQTRTADYLHDRTMFSGGPYDLALLVSDYMEFRQFTPPPTLRHVGDGLTQRTWNEYRSWCEYNGARARIRAYPEEVSRVVNRSGIDPRTMQSLEPAPTGSHVVVGLSGPTWLFHETLQDIPNLTHLVMVAGGRNHVATGARHWFSGFPGLRLYDLPMLQELILVCPGFRLQFAGCRPKSFLTGCPSLKRLIVDGTKALGRDVLRGLCLSVWPVWPPSPDPRRRAGEFQVGGRADVTATLATGEVMIFSRGDDGQD
jgi:hypothetical protein